MKKTRKLSATPQKKGTDDPLPKPQQTIRMHITGVSAVVEEPMPRDSKAKQGKRQAEQLKWLRIVIPNAREPKPSRRGGTALTAHFAYLKILKEFVEDTGPNRAPNASMVQDGKEYNIYIFREECLKIPLLAKGPGVQVSPKPKVEMCRMSNIVPECSRIKREHIDSPDPEKITLRLDLQSGTLANGSDRPELWTFKPRGPKNCRFPDELVLDSNIDADQSLRIVSKRMVQEDTEKKTLVLRRPKGSKKILEFWFGNEPLEEIFDLPLDRDAFEAGQHFEIYYRLTTQQPVPPPPPIPFRKGKTKAKTGYKPIIKGRPGCPPAVIFEAGG